MWMRIWQINKMKWYPVDMGKNLKDENAKDSYDFFSSRYSKFEKIRRLARSEFDRLKQKKYEKLDVMDIWKSNSIDMGLGEMRSRWIGGGESPTCLVKAVSVTRAAIKILRENE
jgi:hypothetical protein